MINVMLIKGCSNAASTRYPRAGVLVKRAPDVERDGIKVTYADGTAHCKMAHYRCTIDLPDMTSPVDAP
jgi:hypothetical protein